MEIPLHFPPRGARDLLISGLSHHITSHSQKIVIMNSSYDFYRGVQTNVSHLQSSKEFNSKDYINTAQINSLKIQQNSFS
jgi:hypothetical protein